ncbi:RNA polymerase sigma factor, partial [bacterium]|nr:RNA polymerase sigma factor [bacterium]
EIANYFRKNKKYSISLDKLKENGFEPIALHNPEAEFLKAQEELKKHQDFLKIQDKISQLPIKYQEVITLRFFEKKKIKEISEILGKREGTVKSLLHRGLKELKGLLEKEQ